MIPATDDEARWAEAQSILEQAPTESAEQRLKRWRQFKLLFLAALLLLITVAIVVLSVLFRGTFEEQPSNVPTWQTVVGLVIAGGGLLFQGFGVVALWHNNRRLRAWRSPLAVLSRLQRKGLLAQVRGRQLIEPARVPLALALAEQLVSQRALMAANVGLGIAFIGQWIASPTVWRAVLAITYGCVMAVAWSFIQRDARRARRFLEEHVPSAGFGTEA